MHYSSWGPIYFTLLPFEIVSEGCRMVFHRTYRRRPPPVLHDPRWGQHKNADLRGLRIHYVEKGDSSRPLMIFVHGFPEFWFSWRYQLEHFSKEYWYACSSCSSHFIQIWSSNTRCMANLYLTLAREFHLTVRVPW